VIRDPERNRELGIFVRNDVVLPSSVDWHDYWKNEEILRELASTREERAAALAGARD